MEFINNANEFDQHFLKDKEVINKFIEYADLKDTDVVLEIGPGKGNVSEKIAQKVKKLICVELDERLEPYLNALQDEYQNVEVIYGSILDMEIPECNKIVTSLPYSIIEPLIAKLSKTEIKEIYMIMGNRYIENAVANNITYLSLLTNSFYKPEKLMTIAPSSFYPEPRVMSGIIKLTKKEENELDKCGQVIRHMYNLRHMKTKNALMEGMIDSHYNGIETKRESKEQLQMFNLNDEIKEVKFEVITNSDLKEVYNALHKYEYKTETTEDKEIKNTK